MVHGQGSFDRAVREFTQHMGRDLQTEERRERTRHRQDVYARVGNVTSSVGTRTSIPSSASVEGRESSMRETTTQSRRGRHGDGGTPRT
jgi:hypothetical protein